jgi:hypothetical protein
VRLWMLSKRAKPSSRARPIGTVSHRSSWGWRWLLSDPSGTCCRTFFFTPHQTEVLGRWHCIQAFDREDATVEIVPYMTR